MAITEPAIPKTDEPKPQAPALHNGRWAGFRHLLWARMLELKREPEVVFWVFVFPLLLALGLGIAFRNKPATTVSVAIIDSANTAKTVGLLQRSPAHAASILHTT